jgi:hypothetical protein
VAQHDYVIANGTGAAVRSDLNNALAAIVSNNSGATEPATMYAYQWWADTSTGLLKLRNAANNAWITLRELDGTLTIEAGTVSAPGLAFASDLNTGIYSPSADQLAIATNGVERVEFGTSEVVFNDGGTNYDFRIEGDTVDSLFFVDASTDRVGLGNSSPSYLLDCKSTGATNVARFLTGATTSSEVAQFGRSDQAVNLSIDYDGAGSMGIGTTTAHPFNLKTGAVTRATIDTSGRLGIGTTAPRSLLSFGVADTTGTNGINLYDNTGNYRTGIGGSVNYLRCYSPSDGGSIQFGRLSTSDGSTFLESGRFDSSGRFLVGTSTAFGSNDELLHIASPSAGSIALLRNDTSIGSGNELGGIRWYSNATTSSTYQVCAQIRAVAEGTFADGDKPSRLEFSTTADGASSPTERMRITQAGLLGVNTTSPDAQIHVVASSGKSPLLLQVATNGDFAINFRNASNSTVGSVTVNVSSTAYNTSSDYRLKENVVPLTGAIDRLQQVPVHRFNFIVDPDKTVDGFIAHEAQAVVPECVTGTKDEVDADGNPVYQGIDQSKLVPLLTAALQEAIGRIETLEAEVAALKAS